MTQPQFEEGAHPRAPSGTSEGGQFIFKGEVGFEELTPERYDAVANQQSVSVGEAAAVLGHATAHVPTNLETAPTEERAWVGHQIATTEKLSKLETGALGEQIITDYMKSIGIGDAQSLNVKGNNFPIDLAGDHTLVEVKTGLVSNSASAQQWRATIGQPGKSEREWLATASAAEKRDWNAAKAQEILDRKVAALSSLEKERGVKLTGKTMAVIIDPDRKSADIFVFDGFHSRIGWNSAQAKAGYVKTVKYA